MQFGLSERSGGLWQRGSVFTPGPAPGSRVGGRRGDDCSFLFRPPLSEPCVQLSLHTALQYRSSCLSSGFDFRETD